MPVAGVAQVKQMAIRRSRRPGSPDLGAADVVFETERVSGPLRRESVKKNVAAIHVSGKLTLLQRKLSNVLLLNAYDGLMSLRSHVIDARTLSVMIGYNSNDTSSLKDALRALVETRAEWDILGDDGAREWGVSALLASARLRGGVCEYAYSPALAEKLHDPKIFALINLSIQREFSSGHALALYENCYRFVRTGSTGWWELGLFRRLMGVDESSYYETFKHLNAKIIKPAVTEVNAVSNIQLKSELRRQGRAVSHVRFAIRERAQESVITHTAAADHNVASASAESDTAARLRSRLLGLGVAERLARQWIDDHGAAYVAEKLDYVAAQSLRGRVRGSPVGYLSAALRDDWHTRKPETGAIESKASGCPSAEAAGVLGSRDQKRRIEAARYELAALRKAYRVACFDAVEALATARNTTQRDSDRRQFLSYVQNEIDREDFRLRGWRSAVNASAIFAFWEQIMPGMLPRIDDLARQQGLDVADLEALTANGGGE